MKKFKLLKVVLMVGLVAIISTGCAKSPTAEEQSGGEASVVVETLPKQVEPVPETTAPTVTPYAGTAPVAVMEMKRIHFDFDQYSLTDKARATLAANAEYLKANSGTRVSIEGHCDERGSDEYNLALGERRAVAAKGYLISLGIDGSRLQVISYGEEMPLLPGVGEEIWAKNRRAEFKPLY